MKDVLLSNAGVQVYIIDGSRRTDAAARAVITALYNAGRVCKEAAERAWSDRATLDKIKRNMLHVQMEERETETGKRWTFYTAGCVYMDISAYSRNYIRADKQGNIYATEAPTETEITEGKEDTTTAETEPQRATESAEKTADDTTTAASDADHTEASQQCTESAKATTGRNGEARTARHDRPPRMPQGARKTHHPTKYTPTAQKAHTGQNTKPRQAARDGRKATENTRKIAFFGSDVNGSSETAIQKHPPPFVKRFRQRFETLISDRFLRSGVRG